MLLESYCKSKWDTASDFQGVHHFSCVRASPQGACWEEGVFFQMPSSIPASPASIGTQKVHSATNRQHSNAELHWHQFMGLFLKINACSKKDNKHELSPKVPSNKRFRAAKPYGVPKPSLSQSTHHWVQQLTCPQQTLENDVAFWHF